MAVFEQVAQGKLSPNAAAALLVRAEREAREFRRPRWMPKALWTYGGLAAVAALGLFGFRRDA